MGRSKLADIIYTITLDDVNQLLKDAYNARYNGDWSKTSKFVFHNNKIELFAPAYTKYVIYGSRGKKTGLPFRKFPPRKPIESWIRRYNVNADVDEVRGGIYWYGTKGNDFISKVFPKMVQAVKLETVAKLTTGILTELHTMRFGKK